MARKCTICSHEEREAIDAAIVAGDANRRIAARYDLSETSVRRHRDGHLLELVQSSELARQAADDEHAVDLLRQVGDLVTISSDILAAARKAKDLRTALLAIRETARCLELQGKLLAAAMAAAAEEDRRRERFPTGEDMTEEELDRDIRRIMGDLTERDWSMLYPTNSQLPPGFEPRPE